jgi:hypothetical protein
MNRMIWMLICLASLISACAPARTGGMGYQATPQNCEREPNKPPNIKIHANLRLPTATPPNRCIRPGDTITFEVKPTVHPLNSVSIIAKPTNPDGGGPTNWLNGSNTAANTFQVTVPSEADLQEYCHDLADDKCYFEYSIYVKFKDPVDPRVTVRK